ISGDPRKEVFLASALVSRSTSEGNICLDLKDFTGRPSFCPSFPEWRDILAKNPVVGRPGEYRPLILDDKGRLYLYRYWDYERILADFILERAKGGESSESRLPADVSLIKEKLDLFFPLGGEKDADWQKLAAALSIFKSFTVISGSPGTGKTTTATKIIALLLELTARKKMSIALTAPTGKAAARLQEAVKKTGESLHCSETTRAAIPEKASTIHRLLGNLPNSPYFLHHRENPLPVDAVIVDEASMLDLPLLSKLVQALPAHTKLILLGDKDQLTSVEAGAVLGDICGAAQMDVFSQEFIEKLKNATGGAWEEILRPGGSEMNDCLVQLKKNYRFGEKSGIGRVSAAVNEGDGTETVGLLKSGAFSDIGWSGHKAEAFLPFLRKRVVEGFRDYLTAISKGDAGELFDLFDSFRVLCALRQGPWGVEAINAVIERLLAEEGLIEPKPRWYPGRPVMITVNDYQQRLFNGDVGVVIPDGEAMFELRVFFRDASGAVRKFLPSRLPAHETVYAMTVHKSQGSEFDRVLFVLPDRDVPLLTRELLYTGITRAKSFVEIWGKEEIFREAVSRRITRKSGLGELLWG
ncbi:MAG: exodeoxyribonuclease V subunit alpha, partial [Syntrophales bacterium]|nr:exodeoxyribonuclease V subunit alpha [Syntrophales bacterium]